ncbi:MAG: hypothetical protein KGO52_15145 [Nitrospirota bacterium]|nr:hypothetical protein [Nitrospirota bacterium]
MGARRTFKAVAATLALGLLLLLGATTGSAFAHEVQHAGHHSAAMHSQGICAWMCAVGHGLQIVVFCPPADFAPSDLVFAALDRPGPSNALPTPPTRGPPACVA